MVLGGVGNSDATVATAPFIEKQVKVAQIVARVHIDYKKRFVTPYLPQEKTCGFIYGATVVEKIKGDYRKFEFFSSTPGDFADLGRDYLVFVYSIDRKLNNDSLLAINQAVDLVTINRIRCLTAADLYVPVPFQNSWAFDIDSSNAQEWLVPPNRPDLSWCTQNGTKGPQGNYATRPVLVQGKQMMELSWDSAKTLIRKALGSGMSPDC